MKDRKRFFAFFYSAKQTIHLRVSHLNTFIGSSQILLSSLQKARLEGVMNKQT